MRDALKHRLEKLLALADRGVGGEATNARAALEKTLRQNGLTLEDVMDDTRTMAAFRWCNSAEKRLLVQIMVAVCGTEVELFRFPRGKKKLLAKMTAQQRVEIDILWTAHRRQLQKEIDLLFMAYVHKHSLFPRDGKQMEGEVTPEQERKLKQMAMMMMGMEDVTVRRQLCK